MTDREASDQHFRHYEKPSITEKLKQQEAAQKEADERFAAMDLEQKRQSHADMCRSWGFKQAQIDAAWDKYLRTGKM